jgi:hypothetical protein
VGELRPAGQPRSRHTGLRSARRRWRLSGGRVGVAVPSAAGLAQTRLAGWLCTDTGCNGRPLSERQGSRGRGLRRRGRGRCAALPAAA